MDLLCGVPKAPRSSKPSNWGSWGRMGFISSSSSYAGDTFHRKSSTMPGRLGEGFKGSSSRVSPSPLRRHILPSSSDEKRDRETIKDDPYNTLFSIPEGEDGLCSREHFVCGVTSASCPLRRSRTLPASAIRRSNGEGKSSLLPFQELNRSRDDLSIDAPTLRTLKDKFRLESLRRHLRNKTLSKKEKLHEDRGPSHTIYTIPRSDTMNLKKESTHAFRRNLTMPAGNHNRTVLNSQAFRVSRHSSVKSDLSSVTNVDNGKEASVYPNEMYPGNGTERRENSVLDKKSNNSVRVSQYQKPNDGSHTDSVKEETKELIHPAGDTTPEPTSSDITPDKPFDNSDSSSESCLDQVPVPENIISNGRDSSARKEESSLSSPLYSEPLPSKCESIPEEESSDRAERHSLVSSASEGSRLTFGTSTDEGICSIYSETSSSLWSSSASSAASTCSTRFMGKENTYPATDEGMSVYSCMSSASSYASSFSSGVSASKGAVPKIRASSSFRRCRGRDTHGGRSCSDGRTRVKSHCNDVSDDKEMCGRCKREAEEGIPFKRGGSLRAPKQLPVTPTLLRLLQLGLEQVGGVGSNSSPNVGGNSDVTNGVVGVVRREKLHPPRTDPHRLSRANLEESGDLELDAILNELCALENKFNFEISSSKPTSSIPNPSVTSTTSSSSHLPTGVNSMPSGALINSVSSSNIQNTNMPKMQPQQPHQPYRPKTHARNGSGGGFKAKYDSLNVEMDVPPSTIVTRTDSPDNDSAFSDNVSMLSSESSASSGASGGGGVTSKQEPNKQLSMTFFDRFLESVSLSQEKSDQAAKVKAEKIKMALEKLKEANVKKLFIKAFSHDGSSKSLLVDEKMTVAQVCRMLTDKNHVRVDPKWAVVEHLPDLYMERIYEDDEMLVDNLLMWTRDSKNKLLFVERLDKYDLFFHPENYLLYGNTQQNSSDIDDEARNNLLEEFFSSSRVPEVEGPLFLKSEGKKAWKKFYFVLRQSGLYYCPKGKSSRSSKDLVCLATLENNQVYHGFGWKKKFKAPTDWGFAIKLPHLQAKSSKHIKYLCAEDENNLNQWVMGIRIAKNGHHLQDNYRSLVEDIAQEDIDRLASSRSFSLASVTASSRGPSEATTPSSESRSLDSCLAPSLQEEDAEDACSSAGSSSQDTPVNTLCRAPAWRHDSLRSGSSSSSSGCLSERSSSTGTPPIEGGFEADFPQQGTIKRKPSSNPKIPLTSTTRHLVKEVDRLEDDGSQRTGSLRHSTRRSLSEEVSTLRRRNSSSVQGRTSVASSVTANVPPNLSIEEDDVDSLPLPPPPMEMGACDPDLLPPPPPELLASTLSLNSLPPPPDEASMPSFVGEDLMTASITSLPPPPPPPPCLPKPPIPTQYSPSPPATPPKPKVSFSPQPLSPPAVAPKPRRDSSDSVYATRGVMSPSEHLPPPINSNGWQPHSPSPPPPPPPIYAQPQKSPQKKKKITFLDDVQSFPPSPCPSPPCPQSPSSRPPQPPKRSLSTKLSQNPGRLDAPGCKVTPPKSFLNNLQRVMQKKWQVAQKCRDFDKMPHEVLGFRDPLPQVETEKNVGAWIQEHYGSLYENLAPQIDSPPGAGPPNGAFIMDHHPQPKPESSYSGRDSVCSRISQTVPGSRKKPPPPPKRSDTTHLSMRQ